MGKTVSFKVLVLGNYYSCRVKNLAREVSWLSGFVHCLFLSSFQCIADGVRRLERRFVMPCLAGARRARRAVSNLAL